MSRSFHAATVLVGVFFAMWLMPRFVSRLVAGEREPASLIAVESSTWEDAAPDERIQRDWIMQDAGFPVPECFANEEHAECEKAMLVRVADELGEGAKPFRERTAQLVAEGVPGADPRWKSLYIDACRARRALRLAPLVATCPRVVYTKHYNIGGSHYAYTENPTDAQLPEREGSNKDWRMGAELRLLRVTPEGRALSRLLLNEPDGLIRDPEVSYDATRILFARRDTAYEDDFHLYEIDVEGATVRQLTFGLGFGDIEPTYLPNGDILFNSTRCMQITDCFWTDVGNLYACDKDGRFLRRIGFDQVHTNYPKVLEDGRVIYTRWDYNDRGQIYPQPLFVMNYDGTGQTEFYGNNSWFPTTILHARGIPGTQKLVAVASGHHSHQRGKLILIDRSRGNQEADGIELIAPRRETPAARIDAYGQEGDQFQYPFPLDETRYLVTYDPIGSPGRRYAEPYGIYLMDIDGRRELLAWDAEISCNQPVPLAPRPVPRLRRSTTDYRETEGDYYVQDIYMGQGLAGVTRGTIKKIRVVALQYRAAGIRKNISNGPAGGALSCTPVSIGNGCWDVKIVLGEATVYDDGSAWFKAPARTPVYFQALDDRNQVVQTMRSWSTLQPGETFSCVGCHETKNQTPLPRKLTVATKYGPQQLEPFYGPPRGFSYEREIQSIFDHHCVACHHDRSQTIDWETPFAETSSPRTTAFSLLGNTTDDEQAGRRWADSYLALTRAVRPAEQRAFQGQPNRLVAWVTTQSEPSPIPPYHAGSARSELYTLLDQGHAGVQLSPADLDKIACWIDLGVPYCGDYTEANLWNETEQAEYDYYLAKRHRMREIEELHRIAATTAVAGVQPAVEALPTFDAGGPTRKQAFLRRKLEEELPILGLDQGRANRYRNLAFNPEDTPGKATCYPHASSNSDYKSLPWFSAHNALNGKTDNQGHGRKFPSWGPHKRTDLWWQVEFGRPVEVDQVVIYVRADFPHDDCWHSAALEFSDGTRLPIKLKKTAEAQRFQFDRQTTSYVRLTDLVETLPLDWCGLTEVEVWGRDRPE